MIRDHGWVHETTQNTPTSFLDLILIAGAGALVLYLLYELMFGGRK